MATILMMSINLNANMNSNINAYATIMDNLQSTDNIGQSLECVIVVVGCDGTGSVGSSGDTIIGSNDGSDDNNTNGGNAPIPPIDPGVCETCLGDLSDAQLAQLRIALGLGPEATLAEICLAIDALATVEALVLVLDEAGLSLTAIVDLLACLGIDLSVLEVTAILGL